MKAPLFDYFCPTELLDALALLEQLADDVSVLAGGQSLLAMLNLRVAAPRAIVDIGRLESLRGICVSNNDLVIGALTTHSEVAASHLVHVNCPLVSRAVTFVAHEAIRNRGTIGGSIALADPAAEMPACLVALEGKIVLCSGKAGERRVGAEEFFQGPFTTDRAAEELLVRLEIPVRKENDSAWFGEIARRKGDFALVGAAITTSIVEGRFNETRVVMFGVGDRPLLAVGVGQVLQGKAWNGGVRRDVEYETEKALAGLDHACLADAAKCQFAKVLVARGLSDIWSRDSKRYD